MPHGVSVEGLGLRRLDLSQGTFKRIGARHGGTVTLTLHRRVKIPPFRGVGVYGTPGAPSYVPPSGSTAKTLILVGLIFELIFALVYLFVLGVVAFVFAAAGVFPVFGVFYIGVGVIGFIFLYLVWMFCYKPVQEGRYQQARTPTLIFAILSLVTINIIAGILYLIAYIKLGDAVREQQMPPPGYPGAAPMMTPGMAPYGGQPMQQPMQPMQPMQQPMGQPMGQPMQPMSAQPMTPPPAPTPTAAVICPRCGKPATYIPQYNRYYCYTDQQYV